MFKDRIDAGLKLANELKDFKNQDCIILGIPRGGAIVAYEISKRLSIPWDIIVPRKIGAPFNKEVAIGAVTQDGYCLINEEIKNHYNISDVYIKEEIKNAVIEIKRRVEIYRGSTQFPDVVDKTVIIVDDGIATGFTIAAAVSSLKKYHTKKIIIATPVAPVNVIDMLARFADKIICVESPVSFTSVGACYENFEQSEDNEVIDLFRQSYFKRLV